MIDDVFDAMRRSRFSHFVIGCDQGSNGQVGQKPDWLLSDLVMSDD